MTTYTHADLTAAIEKAREDNDCDSPSCYIRDAHLDTLAAILGLHPEEDGTCQGCLRSQSDLYGDVWEDWPCPTAQVVVDALTRMGAL